VLDPNTGRWFEEDPEGFAAGDPNLDRYVGNNPTNATDPTGELGLPMRFPWPGELRGPIDSAFDWAKAKTTQFIKDKADRIRDAIQENIAAAKAAARQAVEQLPEKLFGPVITPPRQSGAVPNSYYPPQAYLSTKNKVAIVTNNTTDEEPDRFTWVTPHQHWTDIGGYSSVRHVLKQYRDGSIDVLVISGHRGNFCTCATGNTEQPIGGYQMPDDIYDLVWSKLSDRGVVVIAGCHCGGNADYVRQTADAFGVPIVVTPGWTRGDIEEAPGGGSSVAPWYTARPGMTRQEIQKMIDDANAVENADRQKPGSIWPVGAP
jgi:hypothetical protein